MPINNLEKWGTINPTNPINPPIETALAAKSVATAPIRTLDLNKELPRLIDNSSPKDNKFNCLDKNNPINNANKIGIQVIFISLQPLALRLPISQVKAAWTLPSSTCNIKVAWIAPNKLLIATPPNINLSTEILLPFLANRKTTIVVNIAPDQAAIGMNICANPKLINETITKPEPADIPNKYGLAKPFLSMPWRSAPDIPKAEPTSKEANNRGNLRSQIIVWLISSPRFKIAKKISLFEIYTEPFANENREIITKKEQIINDDSKNFLFRYLILTPHVLFIIIS